jgi:hypothetical protein
MTKTTWHRNLAQRRLSEALKNATRDGVYCPRREAILTRRKAVQIRTFVARRQRYRQMRGNSQNARAGTPGLYPNSPPDPSQR